MRFLLGFFMLGMTACISLPKEVRMPLIVKVWLPAYDRVFKCKQYSQTRDGVNLYDCEYYDAVQEKYRHVDQVLNVTNVLFFDFDKEVNK